MSTLSILSCSIEWQPVISAIPGICWGILGLVLICVLLRRVAFPLIANSYEIRLKKENFIQETEWFDKKNAFENLKASTDEELNKQVKELKTKVSELEGKLKAEEFNKELLEKQLKMYNDIFEQLKVEVKPKV